MKKNGYTEKRKECNKRWDSKYLYRMTIALPQSQKQNIIQYAKEHNYNSVHNMIVSLIERETGLQLTAPTKIDKNTESESTEHNTEQSTDSKADTESEQ